MKKIFKTLAIVAVAALGFACQNDIDEQVNGNEGEKVTVEVVGSVADLTRSVFGAIDTENNKVPSTWSGNETVGFSVNGAALVSAENTAEAGATASFSVEFDAIENENTVYAFSPAATFGEIAEGVIAVNIPATQTPLATSVAENVHLLAANATYNGGAMTMNFGHIAAYGKMNITGFDGEIESVAITFPNGVAGACEYDYVNEAWSGATEKTITLEGNQSSYWFGIAPTGEMTSGEIVVEVVATNDYTYRKTIDLSKKSLGFEAGKVSNFTVNMGTNDVVILGEGWVLVEDASTLQAGDEVIIAAADDTYAMSTNQKSSNRGATLIAKSGKNLDINSDVQIFTLEAGSVAGTWAFSTDAGYLYAASSSGNQLKTGNQLNANSSFEITIDGGVTSVVAKESSNRNVMQYNYNNGSPLFACYASASQSAVCIYKKGMTVTAKPKAERNAKFTPDAVDVILGLEGEFETPNFTFDGDGEPEYNSNNAAVSVSANGDMTINEFTKNTTVTITATVAESEEYKLGSASCTISLVVPTIDLSTISAWAADDDNTKIQTITVTNEHSATISLGELTNFTASVEGNTITVAPKAVNEGEEISENLVVTYTVGTYSATKTITLTQNAPAVAGVSEFVFSNMGYANQAEVTVVEDANNTITFDKGSNSNAPKYYTTGSAVRVYGGNTFTVSSANNIVMIVMTFASGENANEITANSGTFSTDTWTGSAQSVTFTIDGTSGHRRIASITVYNEGATLPEQPGQGGGETPDPDPEQPGQGGGEPVTDTIVAKNAGFSNSDDIATINIGNNGVTAVFAKGDNANNGPKYYTTGEGFRMYPKNTVAINAPSGKKITKVVFTYSTTSYCGTMGASVGSYSLDSKTGTWTGSADSITFTNNATSSHQRIQQIAVTFQ